MGTVDCTGCHSSACTSMSTVETLEVQAVNKTSVGLVGVAGRYIRVRAWRISHELETISPCTGTTRLQVAGSASWAHTCGT